MTRFPNGIPLPRSGAGRKYHNRKTITEDGEAFDSLKERRRWAELKLLERAGKISDLHRQMKYELIPAQYDRAGKLLERSCSYVSDFSYMDDSGELVVEDTKGVRTKEYVIKRKLMLERYGIRIQEV